MQANPAFYREFLRSELDRRVKRNPRYSLRAFSKFLGVDVGALSRLLANKQTITIRTATKICQNMGLDQEETKTFLDSVSKDRDKIGNRNQSINLEGLVRTLADTVNVRMVNYINREVPQCKIREILNLELQDYLKRIEELLDLNVILKVDGNLKLNEKFTFLKDL
ncbi:MAG: hypothetical protein OEZ01_14455 [Candidatus Heimdallarchaeota archaeon]|nr:hypothetical protein [Bdellovibrionales bacterium]MDH5647210.1 hypothetical protein [Candidatus Heimdallarchaeota archaeon]